MGPDIKIDIFSVTIESIEDKAKVVKYKHLYDKFKTAKETFGLQSMTKQFVSTLDKEFTKNTTKTKAIKLNSKFKVDSSKYLITGNFSGGSTGLGGELVKGKQKPISYDASAINSKNLFFLIWFHPESNKGILFVQGYSNFSANNGEAKSKNQKMFFTFNHNAVIDFDWHPSGAF